MCGSQRAARLTASVLAVLFGLAAAAQAAPFIRVGTHYLQGDLPGQEIGISVTGGDPVQGLELNVQIEDATFGPMFEYVDVLNETIFTGNNRGLFEGSYIDPWRAYVGVVTRTGAVPAEGLIATLTMDTTGIHAGTYRLSLTRSIEGPTNFAGIDADITDGWIVIGTAPEPTACWILLGGLAALRRRPGGRKTKAAAGGRHRK